MGKVPRSFLGAAVENPHVDGRCGAPARESQAEVTRQFKRM